MLTRLRRTQAAGIFDTVNTRIAKHKLLLRQLEASVASGTPFDATLQRQFNRITIVRRAACSGPLLMALSLADFVLLSSVAS